MFRKLIIIITFTSIFIEGLLVAHAQDLNMVIPISMLLLMSVLAYIILTGMVIYLTEKEVVEVLKEISVYGPPIEATVDKLVENLFEEKGVDQVDIGIDMFPEDDEINGLIEATETEEDDIIGIIEIDHQDSPEVIEIDSSLLKETAINTDLDIDLEKIMLDVEDDPELIEQLKAIDNIGKGLDYDYSIIDEEIVDSIELTEKEV